MAMTDAQLRAKIRELMAAGVLPSEPAPIQRSVPPAPTGPKPHMFVRDSLLDQACTICGQLAPQFQFSTWGAWWCKSTRPAAHSGGTNGRRRPEDFRSYPRGCGVATSSHEPQHPPLVRAGTLRIESPEPYLHLQKL